MSNTHHYARDSEAPVLPNDGILRLYSMRFCPYAARVHLVLNAKQIRHHTININLQSKPQWFLANLENPQGKVPVLCITDDTNQTTLIESLIIMEYLDSKYADVSPQLVPTDALKKAQEFIWINRFQDVTLGFERFDFARIELGLKVFEEELTRRGTVYFGGDTPNILDYAIWPWLPRLNFIPLIFGEDVTFDKNQYPALVRFNESLIANDRAVREYYIPQAVHKAYYEQKLRGSIDYDLMYKNENN